MRIYKPEGTSGTKFTGFKYDTIENFMNNGTIVEAPVTKCDSSNLSLYFDLGNNIYGILPFSELEYNNFGKTKSVAAISRVAKYTCFKIKNMSTDEDGKVCATLSRKDAQKECYDNYIKNLQLGQVIEAKITHVEEYGAFCDIGCGIIALLPIEHFSVARIRDPKTALKPFKSLKVIVKSIDNYGRILLSQKELLGTWEEEAAKFKTGEVVVGTVRIVEDYGVFVELTPNLSGLAEPVAGMEVGTVVSVYIKSIIPDKMKVKLLIVDSENIERPFTKLDYRIPEDGFVRHWVYSPSSSAKKVESIIVKDESDASELVDESNTGDN